MYCTAIVQSIPLQRMGKAISLSVERFVTVSHQSCFMSHESVMCHVSVMSHLSVRCHVSVMSHLSVMCHVSVMSHLLVMCHLPVMCHVSVMSHLSAMCHVTCTDIHKLCVYSMYSYSKCWEPKTSCQQIVPKRKKGDFFSSKYVRSAKARPTLQ